MVSPRRVTLVVHWEWALGEGPTWWAESEDLPGFTAAYPSLGELQREAEEAVRFALEADEVDIDWVSGGDIPTWAAVHVEAARPGLIRDGGPSSHTFHLTTTPIYFGDFVRSAAAVHATQ